MAVICKARMSLLVGAHHIKSLIGITTDVSVKKPGEIPRSQGKAVRVRDLRPKQ